MLDSRNATTYLKDSYNSSIIFNFINPIKMNKNSINMTCCLNSFSCANSIYIINEYNSFLNINLNGTISYNTFTYGNYDSNTFMTQLIVQLGNLYSISLNSITNKFTLSHALFNFTILSSSTMYEIMGFQNNISISSISKSLVMPYMCNFNGITSINILLDNYNMSNIGSYSKSDESIIQSINIDPSSSLITYNKSNNTKFLINDTSVNYLQIDIMNDQDQLINLNNQNWHLTLEYTEKINFNRYHNVQTFDSILENGYKN